MLKTGEWEYGLLMIHKDLYHKALARNDIEELKWLAPEYLRRLKELPRLNKQLKLNEIERENERKELERLKKEKEEELKNEENENRKVELNIDFSKNKE